jgi:hypothetical protein
MVGAGKGKEGATFEYDLLTLGMITVQKSDVLHMSDFTNLSAASKIEWSVCRPFCNAIFLVN